MRQPPEPHGIPTRIVLSSRYLDHIYIRLLNFPEEDEPFIKLVITYLLARVYGINLKWELSSPQGVTWGEATISFPNGGISLDR